MLAIFTTPRKQTDYEVFNAADQMTQDQQISNGIVVDALNYSNGKFTE